MASWPVLVFDIETIPDVAGLRTLRDNDAGVSDEQVLAQELAQRAADGRSDFLPHHLQRVVTISCVYRGADGLRVHSFVDRSGRDGASDEARIVQQFFSSIDKRVPQLVSWNGGGFDLPVLHYRGLMHGVVASKYWDFGEDDREFKWNNYISRYHHRHLDLMDLLALYQPRVNAPLDAMARLCGLPGKLGMDGSAVHARMARRPHRRHPSLLRDRRDEHLPAVLPLSADARRPHERRAHAGSGDGACDAGGQRRAALGPVPGGLAFAEHGLARLTASRPTQRSGSAFPRGLARKARR